MANGNLGEARGEIVISTDKAQQALRALEQDLARFGSRATTLNQSLQGIDRATTQNARSMQTSANATKSAAQSAAVFERELQRQAQAEIANARAAGDYTRALQVISREEAASVGNKTRLIQLDTQRTRVLQEQARAQQQVGEATAEGSSIFTRMSGQLGRLVTALGAVGVAAGVAKVAFDFGKEGAGIERTRDAFDRLAESAGTSGDAMLAALQKASGGAITDLNLQLIALRANELGVARNADEMGVLLDVARQQAVKMGTSVESAFSDLVTGLGRGSALILDNLGIMVSVTQANETYAESVGKTVAQLTEQEKKQALINQVLADAQQRNIESGNSAIQAADGFTRLSTAFSNLTDSAKTATSDGLEPVAGALADILNLVNEGAPQIDDQTRRWGELHQAISGLPLGDLYDRLLAVGSQSDELQGQVFALLDQFQRTGDIDAFRAGIGELESGLQRQADAAEQAAQKNAALAEEMARATDLQNAAAEAAALQAFNQSEANAVLNAAAYAEAQHAESLQEDAAQSLLAAARSEELRLTKAALEQEARNAAAALLASGDASAIAAARAAASQGPLEGLIATYLRLEQAARIAAAAQGYAQNVYDDAGNAMPGRATRSVPRATPIVPRAPSIPRSSGGSVRTRSTGSGRASSGGGGAASVSRAAKETKTELEQALEVAEQQARLLEAIDKITELQSELDGATAIDLSGILPQFFQTLAEGARLAAQYAGAYSKEQNESSKLFLDTASSAVSAIRDVVELVKDTEGYQGAIPGAFDWLFADLIALTNKMIDAERQFEDGAVSEAATFGEKIDGMLGGIGDVVDAVEVSRDYQGAIPGAFDWLFADLLALTAKMIDAERQLNDGAVKEAAELGSQIDDLVGSIGAVVEAVAASRDYQGLAPASLDWLAADMILLAQKLIDVARQIDGEVAGRAAEVSEAIGRMFAPLSDVIDFFQSLKDYQGVAPQAVQQFGSDLIGATAYLSIIAQQLDREGVSAAAELYDKAGVIFDSLDSAVSVIDKLADPERKGLTADTMEQFKNEWLLALRYTQEMATAANPLVTFSEQLYKAADAASRNISGAFDKLLALDGLGVNFSASISASGNAAAGAALPPSATPAPSAPAPAAGGPVMFQGGGGNSGSSGPAVQIGQVTVSNAIDQEVFFAELERRVVQARR